MHTSPPTLNPPQAPSPGAGGHEPAHLSRADSFLDTARWAGASDTTAAAALACRAPRIVVSGRLASGKDTIAEETMAALGYRDAARVSFATALRTEADALIDVVRALGSQATVSGATKAVADASGVGEAQVGETARLIRQALQRDPSVTSWVRTREVRRILQVWGTDVRRAADGDYWVKRAMADAVALLAAGRAVYVTDARFTNEVVPARRLGFVAVRLEVDLPERARRLRERDGLEIDPEAEAHPSETELEGYGGFDLRVDNSGPLDTTVGIVARAVADRFA